MSNLPTPLQPLSGGYQWVTIDDFSPGIWSQDKIPGATNVPAPKGAASPNGTYQCMALPNGALGPGPGLNISYTYPTLTNPTNPPALVAGVNYFITNTLTVHNGIYGTNPTLKSDEVFISIQAATANNVNTFLLISNVVAWESVGQTAPAPVQQGGNLYLNTSTSLPNGVSPPAPAQPAPMALTTMGITVSGVVYQVPVIVWSMHINELIIGIMKISPDPTSQTTYTTLGSSLTVPSDVAMFIVSHQGRVIFFPLFSTALSTAGEEFFFSDPPNSTSLPNSLTAQPSFFFAESFSSIGTIGSMSTGELIAIKTWGGGYSVSGDIFFPTVQSLPGITPTGGYTGYGAATPAGFVYCSKNNGAWAWNGGSASYKISEQIDDTFFHPVDQNGGVNGPPAIGHTEFKDFVVQVWGDYILFNNNWIYNTSSQSWWRLYNPATVLFDNYASSEIGSEVYAAPMIFTSTNPTILYQFTKTVPAAVYSWVSQPIEEFEQGSTPDRLFNLRRVVLESQGTGTVQVSINGTSVHTFTVNSSTKTRQVAAIAVNALQQVSVGLLSTGAFTPAPVIYSISLGVEEAQQLSPT